MAVAIQLLFSNTDPNLCTELLLPSWGWISDLGKWGYNLLIKVCVYIYIYIKVGRNELC